MLVRNQPESLNYRGCGVIGCITHCLCAGRGSNPPLSAFWGRMYLWFGEDALQATCGEFESHRLHLFFNALVVELVVTLVLETIAVRCEGSSPSRGTTKMLL